MRSPSWIERGARTVDRPASRRGVVRLAAGVVLGIAAFARFARRPARAQRATPVARPAGAVEDEVRAAVDRFYAAYEQVVNGDAAPMLALWSHGPDVTAMHTLGGLEVGWEQVRATWERVADLYSDGRMTVEPLLIRVGADFAYSVGIEHVEATVDGQRLQAAVRATNVFRWEAGMWKAVHHHGDALPAVEQGIGR